MECERNDSDLEEDSELEALRLAALATLKSRSTNNVEPVHSEKSASPPKIPSILSSAVCNRKEPASLPKGQYLWNNSSNQQRRGRGRGGAFPKVNQRSNLIVITPVSTDGNDPKEGSKDYRTSKPQLSLPQHRWCQSVNEDSSSPKTFSKRGPTRFNRHESSSESSDSDYDNSDDSYSNETILQDENSANFSQQTPEESIESESPLRTRIGSDRRLSFQNTNLDTLQGEEGTLSSRGTYCQTSKDDSTVLTTSDSGLTKEKDSTNCSSNKSEMLSVNGISQLDKDYNKASRRPSYVAEDSTSGNGAAAVKEESYTDDPTLTQNDLRLELKKRMLKLRSENAEVTKSEKAPSDNVEPGSDDNQRRYARDSDRTHDRSRSHRSRSSERNRDRLRSSSPRNPSGKHSQYRDRRTETDKACSPVKRRREPSQSPDRNGKRSWSRSPVKKHRTDSFSPDRNSRRNYSRSPTKTLASSVVTQSSVRNGKSSHSPNKSSRTRTPSPDKNLQRDKSSSPYNSYRKLRSLDSKKDDSRKPLKSRKDSLALNPQQEEKSRSPYRSRKRSLTRSPKPHRSQSPDKNCKRLSPQVPEHKPKQKICWSPVGSPKRDASRSPERKTGRSRRDRSRSPVQSQKSDSVHSWKEKRGRRKYKNSRFSSSGSSSELSSRSSSASSRTRLRSVSSVVKPVQSSVVQPLVQGGVGKRNSSPDSDFTCSIKRAKGIDEKPKAVLSLVKSSIVIGENRNNVSDASKRLPVHMRLGSLPRNRLIRMTKDVEAAFVSSSSEDDANTLAKEGKKQNFRVVAEMNSSDVSKRRVEKSPLKNSLDARGQRKKSYR